MFGKGCILVQNLRDVVGHQVGSGKGERQASGRRGCVKAQASDRPGEFDGFKDWAEQYQHTDRVPLALMSPVVCISGNEDILAQMAWFGVGDESRRAVSRGRVDAQVCMLNG
jgi:hypothetical protein